MSKFITDLEPAVAECENAVARLAVKQLTDNGHRGFTNFEVNVADGNGHFFATASRSITDSRKAVEVLTAILVRFPASEGFRVSLSGSNKSGMHMNIT